MASNAAWLIRAGRLSRIAVAAVTRAAGGAWLAGGIAGLAIGLFWQGRQSFVGHLHPFRVGAPPGFAWVSWVFSISTRKVVCAVHNDND
jgi:hypothetical protein